MKRRGPRNRKKKIIRVLLFEIGLALLFTAILLAVLMIYCRMAGPLLVVWR